MSGTRWGRPHGTQLQKHFLNKRDRFSTDLVLRLQAIAARLYLVAGMPHFMDMPSTLFIALIGYNWTEALEIAGDRLGVEPGGDQGEVECKRGAILSKFGE